VGNERSWCQFGWKVDVMSVPGGKRVALGPVEMMVPEVSVQGIVKGVDPQT